MIDPEGLTYRPLARGCPLRGFRCGEPSIDHWLRKDALRNHNRFEFRVTTVHVGQEPDPVGFYSLGLVLEEERFLKGTGPIRSRVVGRVFPAIHLEYLAVRSDMQGQTIGQTMLARVVDDFIDAVETMGVPVLTLVPLNDKLLDYYGERDFVRYAEHTGDRRMMMTAAKAMEIRAAALAGTR